jgi:uncharacterized membrane protein
VIRAEVRVQASPDNAVLDRIHTVATFCDWSFTNGLIGLIAGVAGYCLLENASPSQRVKWVAVVATLAVIGGLASTIRDILMGSTFF